MEHHEHTHKWYTFGCKDATYLMTKAEHDQLSFSEKFLLQFHMLTCKYCRRFKVQIEKIQSLIRKGFQSNQVELSSQKKQALNQLITKNLEN